MIQRCRQFPLASFPRPNRTNPGVQATWYSSQDVQKCWIIDLDVVDLPAQIGEKDWVGRLWWLDSRDEIYAGMGLEFNLCGSFGCEGPE